MSAKKNQSIVNLDAYDPFNLWESMNTIFLSRVRMMKRAFIVLVISFFACSLQVGCKKEDRVVQEAYDIEIGGSVFRIPQAYLIDSRNRKSGVQKFTEITASIPALEPLEVKVNNIAPRGSEIINFNLNDNPMAEKGMQNILEAAKAKPHVNIPEYSKLSDGLHKIGYNGRPGEFYEDMYIFIQRGKPISFLRCGRKPESINPSCFVSLLYNESLNIYVNFSAQNLKWYTEEKGLYKILDLVRSWRVATP